MANCDWQKYVSRYRRRELPWQHGPLRETLWLREDAEPLRAEAEHLLDLQK